MPDHATIALDVLESRLRTLLPPEYQDSYETLEPKSMGSAGLTPNKTLESTRDTATAGEIPITPPTTTGRMAW